MTNIPNNEKTQVKIRDQELIGVYSNVVQVSHTKEEFILDFINLFDPTGVLVARVIVNPNHVPRIIDALKDNLTRFLTNEKESYAKSTKNNK